MNKYLFTFLICLCCFSFSTRAQEYSFGIKGGINYAFGGEVVGKASTVNGEDVYNTDTYNPESKIGFHGGVFFQLKFGRFFIRPEAIYSSVTTTFSFVHIESDLTVEKISIPVLLGYNVWGPIDVYAGPAYQNIINATMENTKDPIIVQNSPIAAQAGVKFNFGRFELDFRYDKGLASKEVYEIDVERDRVNPVDKTGVNVADFDGRLDQFLVSLSFKIGDSEKNSGRRRGRGCFF